MIKFVYDTIKNHYVWAILGAAFSISTAFAISEYSAAEENDAAIRVETRKAASKAEEMSRALELMRQQQAFFGLLRNHEDQYDPDNLSERPRLQLAGAIDDQLDALGELRQGVGQSILELRSEPFENSRLKQLMNEFVADLLLADGVLQERMTTLRLLKKNPARLSRILKQNKTPDAEERLRRIWDAADARGEQASKLFYGLLKEFEDDAAQLNARKLAAERKLYLRKAAVIYSSLFIVAFGIWAFFHQRKVRRSVASSPTQPAPGGPAVTAHLPTATPPTGQARHSGPIGATTGDAAPDSPADAHSALPPKEPLDSTLPQDDHGTLDRM